MSDPASEVSAEDFKTWQECLPDMDQEQLARLARFAGPGHPVFMDSNLFTLFRNTFTAKGGMTPELSKRIGWTQPKGYVFP